MSTKAKAKGKGKKGKKGKEKPDPNRLTNVDRTFYELTIADLNNKIARLRALLKDTDQASIDIQEQVRSIREDGTDEAAHLHRTLIERNEEIVELRKSLNELKKAREDANALAAKEIKDRETKIKALNDQLTSEIKIINGNLNTLEEFREKYDQLVAKADVVQDATLEMERIFQEEIEQLRERIMDEQNVIKKDVETKLLNISEKFMRKNLSSNAGYTRRLVRENIAIRKEVDQMVSSQVKMQQYIDEEPIRKRQAAETIAAKTEAKELALGITLSQLQIIEKLTKRYERLRADTDAIRKYRQMYDDAMKSDVCERGVMKELMEQIFKLEDRKQELKMEKERAEAGKSQHDAELKRLANIFQVFENVLKLAIGLPVPNCKKEELDSAQERGQLLQHLLDIICEADEEVPYVASTHSVARSAKGIPEPPQLRTVSPAIEGFRRKVDLDAAVPLTHVHSFHAPPKTVSTKARDHEGQKLFDVQLGSELFVSSSHEMVEEAMVEGDEEHAAGEEEGESSSLNDGSASGATSATTTEPSRASVQPSALHRQASLSRFSNK